MAENLGFLSVMKVISISLWESFISVEGKNLFFHRMILIFTKDVLVSQNYFSA